MIGWIRHAPVPGPRPAGEGFATTDVRQTYALPHENGRIAAPRLPLSGIRDVPRHLGARHRRHPDHHGAARHAPQAPAVESRHSLSGHRLCAGPGGMGAHGAGPAPSLRRPGKDGGSRAAHLAVRSRTEARRSAARQALVPAAAPGIPVDGTDGGVRRGHRRLPARAARGRGDPARRDSGAHRSRACIGRAGRRFVGSRPPPLQPDRRGRPQRWRRVSGRDARPGPAWTLRFRRRRLALAGRRRGVGHRRRVGDRRRPGGIDREAGSLPAHTASGGGRSRRVPGARADRDRLRRRAAQLRFGVSRGVCRRTRAAADQGALEGRTSRRARRRSRSSWARKAKRSSRPTPTTPAPT